MKKCLLSDSSGNKSVTVTAFVVGFIVVNIKLLLADITVGGVTLSPFSGSEYGVAMAALGGIYVLRRATEKTTETK